MKKKWNITSRRRILTFGLICILTFGLTCNLLFSNLIPDVDSSWTDLISSRKKAISKLPTYATYPLYATNWTDYAEKSINDLLTFDESWFIEPATGIKGFRPYVKGADGWGGEDWTRDTSELISTIDVIWPLYQYLRLHPNATRQAEVEEFMEDLPEYYWKEYKQSTNRPHETRHDSWYFMENSILKWGHLFSISNFSKLEDPYFGSLSSALKMAENFNYLFPQFVDVATKQQTTNLNINYCTAGLLAFSLINAYELTGNTIYLSEATNALTKMRTVNQPPNLMYEPQELAAGIAAAAKMTKYVDITDSTIDYAQHAIDLFYAEEQVLYYDNGKIDWSFGFNPTPSPWLPSNWRDGMHSPYANPKEIGTGGINAPAYKENIESIMFWADYLKYLYFRPGFRAIEPLKILNLNRIKNFYFFSPSIPDEWERDYGPNTLQYVPYEDIDYHNSRGSYDLDPIKAGYNGKEIYGAGETLWNYLMFEALGKAEDNNSLILNLNFFDQSYPPSPEERSFIVFNPYSQQQTLSFTLTNLSEPYDLYANGSLLEKYQPGEPFNISLPPRGSAYMTLVDITTDWTIPILTTTTEIPQYSENLPIITFIGISLVLLSFVLIYAIFPKKK
ncbi:MAG: hypothetical protein ACXAC8_02720 [Candidatus Hodarchaeales archaeon]|jgi:hypothetical protein